MPRRNTLRKLLLFTLYHVYNRESDRAPMFLDDEDRRYFRELLRRYLSLEPMYNDEYRAVPLTSKRQKLNAIAYVNENHGDNCFCEFCSHRDYASNGMNAPAWLSVRSGLDCFGGVGRYQEWMHMRKRMRELCGE